MLRFVLAWFVYTWGGLHRYFGIQNNVRREFEHAVRYFDRALRLDPTFHRVRLERGVLLFRELNRTEEALADFDAILAEDESFAPALFNRAMLHQQNGRFQLALDDLNAYLQAAEPLPYRQDAVRMVASLTALLSEDGADD